MMNCIEVTNFRNNIFDKIIKSLNSDLFGSPIYILTSSDNVLNYQHQLTNKLDGKGTFRVSVFTFNRLMWHVYNEIGAGDKVQVSRDAHALLLYRIIRENASNEKLEYYTEGLEIKDSSIQHIAFAYEMLKVIEELENYIVDVDIDTYLTGLISKCAEKSAIHNKLSAIQFIYSEYKSCLKGFKVDDKQIQISSVNLLRDFVYRLQSEADKFRNIRAFKNAEVYVDGITSFKPIELKLLQLLQGLGVTIHFEDVDLNEDILAHSDKELLLHINLDKDDLEQHKLDFFEAPNNRVEYDVIAHRILNETRIDKENALSFKDIVVYYRDDKDLLQMIRTFDKYGIPVQYNDNKAITTHPFAQFVLGLFEFANIKHKNKHHLDYMETFIKIIKTRYLTHSVLNTYLDRIDDFVHSYAVTFGEMIDADGHFTPEFLFKKKYGDKLTEDEKEALTHVAFEQYESRTYTDLVDERKKLYEAKGIDSSDGNADLEDMNSDKDAIDIGKAIITEEGDEKSDEKVSADRTQSFVDTMVVLNHVFNKVKAFVAIFDDVKDINYTLNALNDYFSHNNVYKKLSGQYSYYKDEQKNELQQIYNQFTNMIESGFVAFEGYTNDKEETLKILTDMFNTMFDNGIYTVEKKIEDAVQIKLLDSVSVQSYKRAFIANFDRNNTPKIVKDNQVLSDDIKALAGGKLSLNTIERADRDTFLVNLAIQCADQVTISYSTVNSDGRETKESSIVTSLASMLGIQKYSEQYRRYTNSMDGKWIEQDMSKKSSMIIHSDEDYNLLPPVTEITLPLIAQINNLAKLSGEDEITDSNKQWQSALAYANAHHPEIYEKIERYYKFYKKDENNKIDHELAHNLFLSKDRRVSEDGKYVFEPSVSRYQLYNGCAFKHFAQYGLNLQVREPFEIQAKEIGSLQHKVLEEIFKDDALYDYIDDINLESHISTIVDRHFNEYGSLINGKLSHSHYNQYLIHKMKRAILNAALFSMNVVSNSKYSPLYFEKDFGFSQDQGSATVKRITTADVEGTNKTYEVYIKGQIDRIDIYIPEHKDNRKVAYVNVIDYKLSKKDLKVEEVIEGAQLQQYSYMYVIMNNPDQFGLEGYEVLPSSMMFHPVNNVSIEMDNNKKQENKLDYILRKYKPKGMFVNYHDEYVSKIEVNASDNLLSMAYKNDIYDEKFKDIVAAYPIEFAADTEEIKSLEYKTRKIRDKYTHRFIDIEGFNRLIDTIKLTYKKNTAQIFDGYVAAIPKEDEDGNTNPCNYCEFQSVCYFDKNNALTNKVPREDIEKQKQYILSGGAINE